MVFKRDLEQDKTNPNKNKEKFYGLRPHLVVPTPGIVFLLVYYCFIVVFSFKAGLFVAIFSYCIAHTSRWLAEFPPARKLQFVMLRIL